MLQSILYALKRKVWVLLFYYLNVFVVSLKPTGALLKYSCASPLLPLVFISLVVLGSVCTWLAQASVGAEGAAWVRHLEILTACLNVEEVVSQMCYTQAATCEEPEVSWWSRFPSGVSLKNKRKDLFFLAEESDIGRIFELIMVEVIFEAHWATSGLKRRKAVLRAAGTETFMTSEKAAWSSPEASLVFIFDFYRYFPSLLDSSCFRPYWISLHFLLPGSISS